MKEEIIIRHTSLNAKALEIYEGNKARGFWYELRGIGDGDRNVGEVLMLVTSELGEALEADRKNRYANLAEFQRRIDEGQDFDQCFKLHIKDTFEDELADTVIRILDYCGGMGIDLEAHIMAKLAYNALRPYKHGKSY